MSIKPTYTYAATIEKVVDGDTFDVDLDLGMRAHLKTRLRLAHVDAAESFTLDGKNAKAVVGAKMPVGTVVTVATQKPDKYGRAVATVVLADGTDMAQWMLANVPGTRAYEGGTR